MTRNLSPSFAPFRHSGAAVVDLQYAHSELRDDMATLTLHLAVFFLLNQWQGMLHAPRHALLFFYNPPIDLLDFGAEEGNSIIIFMTHQSESR